MVSVDELADILSQTIFSLRGSFALVFCAWYYQKLEYLALAWTTLISIIYLLRCVNCRIVWGKKPEYDPKKDVVMVTGSSGGLGLLITALFVDRGFKVAAVDNRPAPIDVSSSQFLCDVTDEKQVQKVILEIEKEFGSKPLILVSCAGVAIGGTVLNTESDEVKTCIETNVLGSLWALRAVLPHMTSKKRGAVVGVSSSTALASPAGAGIYAASKAAVLTFYESLRYELRHSGVKVLCAVPGQLDTPMFASIKTPSQFWAPVCPAIDIAEKIVDSIIQGRQGQLVHPLYVRLLPIILAVLPTAIVDLLRRFFGIDQAMQTWKKTKLQ